MCVIVQVVKLQLIEVVNVYRMSPLGTCDDRPINEKLREVVNMGIWSTMKVLLHIRFGFHAELTANRSL